MMRALGRIAAAQPAAALAVAITLAGSAYAVSVAPRSSVTSTSIRSGAVHAADLRAGSVTSGKVADGSITGASLSGVRGADLATGALSADSFAAHSLTGSDLDLATFPVPSQALLAGRGAFASAGSCNPGTDFVSCASTSLSLPAAGRLVVSGLAEAYYEGSDVIFDAACEVRVDGLVVAGSSLPVEARSSQTMPLLAESWGLSAGTHTASIWCREDGTHHVTFPEVRVAAVGVLP